jgi:hypothetical protein
MPEYILLLHEPPDALAGFSPDEMQQIVIRYKNWRDSLGARGLQPGGKKLRDGAGRVMKGRGTKLRISNGPYSEAREVIGGFFSFHASSLDEAVEVARECPHLEFGTIEIREVEPV